MGLHSSELLKYVKKVGQDCDRSRPKRPKTLKQATDKLQRKVHIRLRVKSSQCHFGKKLDQRSSVDF